MPQPRLRASYLSFAERNRMRARILRYHWEGLSPTAIGGRTGLTANFVRNVLVESGETLNEQKYGEHIDPMWLMEDEDKRREAIMRRASRGAKKRLDEIHDSEKFPPLSPLPTLVTE